MGALVAVMRQMLHVFNRLLANPSVVFARSYRCSELGLFLHEQPAVSQLRDDPAVL